MTANGGHGSSPSADHAHGDATSLTRRKLLAGAGRIALVAALPAACAPAANSPWTDGTFWDDGLGWTDG